MHAEKIMKNTFFDFSFDFSMAFGLSKRALACFIISIFMLSYSQAYEPHAAVFNKLLLAFTTSDLAGHVLKL